MRAYVRWRLAPIAEQCSRPEMPGSGEQTCREATRQDCGSGGVAAIRVHVEMIGASLNIRLLSVQIRSVDLGFCAMDKGGHSETITNYRLCQCYTIILPIDERNVAVQ